MKVPSPQPLVTLNIRRAHRVRVERITHCKRGHELTPENVYEYGSHRHCKACKRSLQAQYRAARKAA